MKNMRFLKKIKIGMIKKASTRLYLSGLITAIICSSFLIIAGRLIPFQGPIDTFLEFSVILFSFSLLGFMMFTFIKKWVSKAEIQNLIN